MLSLELKYSDILPMINHQLHCIELRFRGDHPTVNCNRSFPWLIRLTKFHWRCSIIYQHNIIDTVKMSNWAFLNRFTQKYYSNLALKTQFCWGWQLVCHRVTEFSVNFSSRSSSLMINRIRDLQVGFNNWSVWFLFNSIASIFLLEKF